MTEALAELSSLTAQHTATLMELVELKERFGLEGNRAAEESDGETVEEPNDKEP